MSREYMVTWHYLVEADTPRRAAEIALAEMQIADEIGATRFFVREGTSTEEVEIDLGLTQ